LFTVIITIILFEPKIKFKGTKLQSYHFACKTGSSTMKNTTQNAPKLTILRPKSKICLPDPSPVGRGCSGEGTPLSTPHPLRRFRRLNPRAYGPRPRRLRRFVLPN